MSQLDKIERPRSENMPRWPLFTTFDRCPNFLRSHQQMTLEIWVKVKSGQDFVYRRSYSRTDGRKDTVKPAHPLNFVGRGYTYSGSDVIWEIYMLHISFSGQICNVCLRLNESNWCIHDSVLHISFIICLFSVFFIFNMLLLSLVAGYNIKQTLAGEPSWVNIVWWN